MEGSLWLHLFNRLCCIHIIKAVLAWAVSQEGELAALQGPGALVAFIKIGCCHTSWVINWNRKQLTFVQIFHGKLDVWTRRVWRRSSLVVNWCIKACRGDFDAQRPKKIHVSKSEVKPMLIFLLLLFLWHQLPCSWKINLSGSSYPVWLEIKTQLRMSV